MYGNKFLLKQNRIYFRVPVYDFFSINVYWSINNPAIGIYLLPPAGEIF